MSLDPVITGTPNDVVWGSDGVNYAAFTRIVRGTRTNTVTVDYSMNNNNAPTGSVTVKGLVKYEIEGELLTSTVLPLPGASINAWGDTGVIVDDVVDNRLRGRATARISAHGFPS